MIVALEAELDKLYKEFGVVEEVKDAIGALVNNINDTLQYAHFTIPGEAMGFFPDLGTMKDSATHFIQTPHKRKSAEEVLERMAYDIMIQIEKGFIASRKLKLFNYNTIASWFFWDAKAINKALNCATRNELLHITHIVGVRIEDKRFMLYEVCRLSEEILASLLALKKPIKDGETKTVEQLTNEFVEKQSHLADRQPSTLEALGALYQFYQLCCPCFWRVYSKRTPFITGLNDFEKFLRKKEFDIWRSNDNTPVKYLGYKSIFDSFHDDLMKLPAIARQVIEEKPEEQQ